MMSSEVREEEGAGVNTTKSEKMKEKLLLAIFSNDVEAFITAIDYRKMTCSNKKRVEQVLLHKQSFTTPGEPYNAQMRNILLDLLQYNLTLKANFRDPDHALNACLNAYKGNLIHIAAAMNRASIISKMLKLFIPTEWIGAAKYLLNAKDSEGHTPLAVAVLGQCDDTVEAICECLEMFPFDHLRRTVLNTAAFQSTFQLPRVPENCIVSIQKLLDKSVALLGPKSGKVFMRKHVCYYWSILKSDLKLLKAQANRCSDLEMENGLPALHFAVYCYSGEELIPKRRAVLQYLIHRPDLSPGQWKVSINDVCNFTFKEGLQFSGTTAHFAVYQTALSYGKQFGEAGQQWSLELRPVTRNVIKMLEFLHQHGADFSELSSRSELRTALDVLPPDNPVVDKLIALMQQNL